MGRVDDIRDVVAPALLGDERHPRRFDGAREVLLSRLRSPPRGLSESLPPRRWAMVTSPRRWHVECCFAATGLPMLRSPSTPMTARGQACTGVLPAGCALERRTRPHARGRGLAGRPREREGGRLFRTVARPRRAIEVLRVSWAAGRRRRCRCLPSTCSDDASPERFGMDGGEESGALGGDHAELLHL
jgi:hypothetical protein